MPIRGEKRQNAPAKRNKLVKMQEVANAYNSINLDKKGSDAKLKEYKETIVNLLNDEEVGTPNGKHLECRVPKGDGEHNIFVQLQIAESVSLVPTAIGELVSKLGRDKVLPYIQTVEVLHENALESLYNAGLITAEEVEELTVTKETPRLIVKEEKIKK